MRATRIIWSAAILVAVLCPLGRARVELDPEGLIHIATHALADSVTVGERFTVTHTVTFPDSLRPVADAAVPAGNCRVLAATRDAAPARDGSITQTVNIVAMTLDLEAARMPAMEFDFVAQSGDTLRAFADEVEVPVRSLATASTELAPLKEQWQAPRSRLVWALAALALVVLGALAWYLLRRRRRAAAEAPEPRLPADYVALSELTRIERMELVRKGEYKLHYTLVVDAVRRYLEARFHLDALDRTTAELIGDFEARGVRVADLEDLLVEADLVKFAKFEPPQSQGDRSLQRARDIVVATRPRSLTPADEPAADVPSGTEGGR